ncbi:non-canonical purine NTP pyrophosphatase, RdgB/HAM1 family [Candidatus Marinamargulisbacteria bacterium SCGC AG-333-B06]|nr:non-canonical purine NTP pyrophosphatase, RdgB/HAM1 family [Candidatus Marinamargulisbacteria bacterium SCGC AG-333-B06]
MNCVIFTNNNKKCDELQAILADQAIDVVRYKDVLGHEIEVIENGLTFEENALKKVRALSWLKDDIKLADDSGIEVDCLDGKPGIYSARYGGESLTDQERCEYLLNQIKKETNRKAQFRCVIAMIFPDGTEKVTHGVVKGTLTHDLRGDSGFGYDPLFIPNEYQKTFAELGSKIKYQISHRGQALMNASNYIRDYCKIQRY